MYNIIAKVYKINSAYGHSKESPKESVHKRILTFSRAYLHSSALTRRREEVADMRLSASSRAMMAWIASLQVMYAQQSNAPAGN